MADKTIHNLNEETSTIIINTFIKEDFIEWYNNGDEINGFRGWIKTTPTIIKGLVPATFTDNTKIKTEEYEVEEEVITIAEDGSDITTTETVTKTRNVVDENGEPVMTKKNWKEYVGNNIHTSLDGETVLIPIGNRDSNGNRLSIILDEELRQWITKFGLDKVLTIDEGETLLNGSKYINNTDSI